MCFSLLDSYKHEDKVKKALVEAEEQVREAQKGIEKAVAEAEKAEQQRQKLVDTLGYVRQRQAYLAFQHAIEAGNKVHGHEELEEGLSYIETCFKAAVAQGNRDAMLGGYIEQISWFIR